jgi:tyrosine-protein phosphatase YwqE
MGIKRVVTTPHTMIDFYPNTTKIITERLAAVQANLLKEEIDVHLTAASEYYIDEHFLSLIEKEPLLTIRNNEVLVEFSMVYEPPMLNTALFKIISAGYKPIIAHPERYIFFHNSFERYEELRDRGCLLQLNLLSLTGYYGKNIMMAAQRMLDSKMYAYCGTDMHHLRHADGINAMLSGKIMQHLVNYPFFNSKLCL